MRLCANAPGQCAIQTALGGYQSINDLVAPGGRLRRQRDLAYELLTAIPGVTLRQAEGGAVHVPAARPEDLPDRGRPAVRLELLAEEKVLIVQGTGFNWPRRIISASCSCPTPTT